jgi:phage terminase large subunit-like protein
MACRSPMTSWPPSNPSPATGPTKRVGELWCVIGRRGGKSKIAAAIAVFEACCVDHSAKLSPGETGHVLVLASTVQQAKVVFNYIRGYVEASPLFAQLVEATLAHEIRLKNNIRISVHPASFRSVRGAPCFAPSSMR